MECEACRDGGIEPWEKWVKSIANTPLNNLREILVMENRRAISYYLARCMKHVEETRDRQDFIVVMMQGLISDIRAAEISESSAKDKMTSAYWIEGRRKLYEQRWRSGFGVYAPNLELDEDFVNRLRSYVGDD